MEILQTISGSQLFIRKSTAFEFYNECYKAVITPYLITETPIPTTDVICKVNGMFISGLVAELIEETLTELKQD